MNMRLYFLDISKYTFILKDYEILYSSDYSNIIQKYSVELCKKINKGGKICHIIMLMIVLKQKKV